MKKWLYGIAGSILVWASGISAAVIFQDDFSDPATSHLGWISTNTDFNKGSFSNGVFTITNSDTARNSFFYHEITPKATVFSFSCSVTRQSSNVPFGFGICFDKQSGNAYIIVVGDKIISIMKPGVDSGDGISCPNLNEKNNTILISKSGTTFNILVNDRLITTFTDDKQSSGDIALMSYPKTAVSFDNVVMTDVFTQGTKATCYKDDFTDTTLSYWNKVIDKGSAQVVNGKLEMTTENINNSYAYLLTDLDLKNFVARVEVSHRDGNKYSMYGLRLNGKNSADYASFVINGSRMFGASIGATGISMTQTQNVKGAAITVDDQTYYYTDTLQVVKKSGSSDYVFYVNGVALDTVSGITFDITSLGFFCQDSLKLQFDNFAAAEGESPYCPVKIAFKNNHVNQNTAINQKNTFVYDLLGRSAMPLNMVNLNKRTNSVASGIFLDNRGNIRNISSRR